MTARMDPHDASAILHRTGSRGHNFHTLTTEQVEALIREADRIHYRAPRNANGSRARYFHAYLERTANAYFGN